MTAPILTVCSLPRAWDALAPDGSEIRLLPRNDRVSMAHGTLPPATQSSAIRHRTIDEIWFVVGGCAEIWRCLDGQESVELIQVGDSLHIPCGTEFQFRTVGPEPFTFIMCTMPPWPGDDEAVAVTGIWHPEDGANDAE